MGIASSFYRWMTRGFQPHTGPQVSGPEGPAASGLTVTSDTAMQIAAAWRCIRLLSEVVASLPLKLYERTESGRQLAVDHPLYRIINEVPNQYQTAVEFLETMQLHLVTRGNAYAEIVRNGQGQVTALLPLYASAMEPILTPSGAVAYVYSEESGQRTIQPDNVLHLKLFGPGPVIGLSPLAYARDSLGLGVHLQTSTSSFFRNGMRPAGALQSDTILKPEHRDAFKKSLQAQMSGSDNAFKLLVLEGGFKYQPVTLSPEDAQMLQQWAFSIEEICRFFGVPPQLVGHTDKSSSWASSLENLNLYFLQYTLQPYLTRWEQAISRKLLSPEDRQRFYPEFTLDSLLRADFKSRSEAYAKALGGPGAQGWMTINEVRRLENLSDLVEGDDLIMSQGQVPEPVPETQETIEARRAPMQINFPQINMPPVQVKIDSPVNVSSERRGRVVREVVERDKWGVPSKVIEREIREGEG